MERILDKLTLYDVEWATGRNISQIKKCTEVVNDVDKKERIKNLKCVICHYYATIAGGAAMTKWKCGICEKEGMSGTTNIPRLCRTCAKEHKLCHHCGADLNIKRRRKKTW